MALEMKVAALDYDAIMSDEISCKKMLKIIRFSGNYKNKAQFEKNKSEALALLKKYNYSDAEIEELMVATGFVSKKIISVKNINKNTKAYRNIKAHVDHLHNHPHMRSYVTVAQIDYSLSEDGWHQWHYFNDEVADVIASLREKKTSTYLSINEFYSTRRNILSLRYLTSFYVDIDCHHDGIEFNLKAVKKFLNKKYEDGILPRHSKLSFTGRGCQIYWKIDLSPASNLWLWQIVQKFIIESLMDINQIEGHSVDLNCSDATRVFRVDDTWNPKAGCYAKNIEQNDNIYRMNQFIEDYFKEKYTLRTKRKKAQANIDQGEVATERSNYVLVLNDLTEAKFRILRQRRCEDLKTLLELRKNQISQGHREHFLFIYAWTAVEEITSESMIYRELASVNSMFVDPLKDNEVKAQAKKVFKKWSSRSLKKTAKENTLSALTGRYVFRNKTIIDLLEISEEERTHFETIFINKAEAERIAYSVRRNEHKRNLRLDENGISIKKKPTVIRREKVAELMGLGYGYKRIAKELGLKENTVKSDVKRIREKGL